MEELYLFLSVMDIDGIAAAAAADTT